MKELPATILLRPFNFETLATHVYAYAGLENVRERHPRRPHDRPDRPRAGAAAASGRCGRPGRRRLRFRLAAPRARPLRRANHASALAVGRNKAIAALRRSTVARRNRAPLLRPTPADCVAPALSISAYRRCAARLGTAQHRVTFATTQEHEHAGSNAHGFHRQGRADHRRGQRHRPRDGAGVCHARRQGRRRRSRCARRERTAATIRQQGGDAQFHVADVTKSAEVQAYVKAALDAYGRIDCFFNNAGIEGKLAAIAE